MLSSPALARIKALVGTDFLRAFGAAVGLSRAQLEGEAAETFTAWWHAHPDWPPTAFDVHLHGYPVTVVMGGDFSRRGRLGLFTPGGAVLALGEWSPATASVAWSS